MWKWLKRLFLLLVLAVLVGVGGLWGLYRHFSADLPELNSLADYRPSVVTRVYARDYQLLGEFFLERRQFLPWNEVPRSLVNAVLAIEDTSFFQHLGVDPKGILRATIANFQAGRSVQGASTITQQVARTFLLSSERTLERKVKEAILAVRIESQFSKEEILELYLNQIYLGAGAYGMAAAARIYFNRDVAELTLGQVALLAGLPKAPSSYDPWRHPEAARKRQGLVLNRMAEVGFITADEAEKALAEPLTLAHPQEPLERVAPYYLEHVRRTLLEEWGNYRLYRGGLEVYTTLSPPLQRAALAALRKGLMEYDRRHGYRGARATVDLKQTGALKAWREEHKKAPQSAGGFYKGVVTQLGGTPERAKVTLVDGREIPLELKGVGWARKPTKERGLGPGIKKLTEVLALGDQVLVEPMAEERPKEKPAERKKGKGEADKPAAPLPAKPVVWQLAQEPEVEAALVSLDPHTGQVLALVGGYDFDRSEFNRAVQSYRQPGSAFKPFIYAAGLDHGRTPITKIDDAPMPIPYRDGASGETKMWRPENYDHRFYGPTTLRVALEHSRNLVTIRLLKDLGVDSVVPYLKQTFGLDVAQEARNLSMALGSVSFSPLGIAKAYAVFANGGKLLEPVFISRVQDRLGRTVYHHEGGDCLLCHKEPEKGLVEGGNAPKPIFGQRPLNPATAFQMTSIMKGVVQRGTARRALALGRPLAGKTGTTNDLRDAWFVGYSPSLLAAVWVGHDDFTTLGPRETGSQAALPIWMGYMQEALKDKPVVDFPLQPGVQLVPMDVATGRPPTGAGHEEVVMEAFKVTDEIVFQEGGSGLDPVASGDEGFTTPTAGGGGGAPLGKDPGLY